MLSLRPPLPRVTISSIFSRRTGLRPSFTSLTWTFLFHLVVFRPVIVTRYGTGSVTPELSLVLFVPGISILRISDYPLLFTT